MDETIERYNQWHKGWLELMWSIGRKELSAFEEDSIGYANQIVTLNCRRHIMIWIYQHLVRYRGLTPIESLDLDVKNKMWEMVKEICADKTNSKRIMIDVAKTFYTLEYFINH